ncbi:MAG: hypothetical protein LKG19_00720 [Saprospiraceae bacterium]|jgi:hypothetical protein|nr:hypothetical protein [Saprospiraceae bacterium]
MDILNIYNLSLIRGLAGFNTVFFLHGMVYYYVSETGQFDDFRGLKLPFDVKGRTMIGMVHFN